MITMGKPPEQKVLPPSKIDHARLRDLAIEEAGQAEKRMILLPEGLAKSNMYLTYCYLLWLSERHEEALLKEKYAAGRSSVNAAGKVAATEAARCL